MPRDSAGNFTLVPGNPVQSGTVVSSTWANSTLDDVSVALTDSLDRYGRGGMLAPFKFSDGTNLLPGAAWVNEPTTGFYRFDGGDLRAAVLTQDVMRWQSTGAQVWNSTDSQWNDIVGGGSGQTGVDPGTAADNTLRWSGTAWVETSDLTVDSTGNVGIGTDSPDVQLDVGSLGVIGVTGSDAASISNSTSGNANLMFRGSTTTGRVYCGATVDDFRVGTDGTERMRIDSTGNVGIGTDSPQAKLNVSTTSSNGSPPTHRGDVIVDRAGITGLQDLGGIEFKCSTFGSGYGAKIVAEDNGALHIGTRANNATWTDRMVIDSSGNVGIGLSAPGEKLSVSGNVGVSGGQILGKTSAGESAPAYSFLTDTDRGMYRFAADTLSFASGGSEMMRINPTRTLIEGGYSELDRVAGTKNLAGTARIYRFVSCTQADYNNLTPDTNTLYIIV